MKGQFVTVFFGCFVSQKRLVRSGEMSFYRLRDPQNLLKPAGRMPKKQIRTRYHSAERGFTSTITEQLEILTKIFTKDVALESLRASSI
jgi:hypothetical protein